MSGFNKSKLTSDYGSPLTRTEYLAIVALQLRSKGQDPEVMLKLLHLYADVEGFKKKPKERKPTTKKVAAPPKRELTQDEYILHLEKESRKENG